MTSDSIGSVGARAATRKELQQPRHRRGGDGARARSGERRTGEPARERGGRTIAAASGNGNDRALTRRTARWRVIDLSDARFRRNRNDAMERGGKKKIGRETTGKESSGGGHPQATVGSSDRRRSARGLRGSAAIGRRLGGGRVQREGGGRPTRKLAMAEIGPGCSVAVQRERWRATWTSARAGRQARRGSEGRRQWGRSAARTTRGSDERVGSAAKSARECARGAAMAAATRERKAVALIDRPIGCAISTKSRRRDGGLEGRGLVLNPMSFMVVRRYSPGPWMVHSCHGLGLGGRGLVLDPGLWMAHSRKG
ncbi:hypothetical protein Scep_029935 [Stephania cephalantha]|uniref:Uncharacterized protein n=1 Tax=Stephania cephalantha TaxID=152367 RepID=A0AAP0DYL7_9MAGN